MIRKHLSNGLFSDTAELGIACGCAGCGASFALSASRSQASVGANQDLPETIEIGPNRRRVGEISEGEQYDVIAINVVAGRNYAVSLLGTGNDALSDPLLGLYDQNGVRLDFDDDGGTGLSSLLTFEALVTGTYHLTAQSAVAGETGGYRAQIWAQPAADQVSDRHSEATLITNGATRGFIDESGDVDIYRIFLEAGKIYTIDLSGGVDYNTNYSNFKPGELDPELSLRGVDGRQLAFGSDLSDTDFSSRMIFSPIESGFFTIEAYSVFGESGGFILDVLEEDKSAYDPLEALRWDDAPNVDFGPDRVGYVYFASAGETFGEVDTRGNPLVGQGWNEFEKGQVMVALSEYEKVLGINYEITTDVSQANFRLIKAVIPQAGIFFPQDPIYGSSQGLGVFNPSVNGWSTGQQQSLLPGGLAFRTILHEFGHAHGLAHPHDTLGGSDVLLNVATQTDLGLFELNQDIYTVMATTNRGWQLHPDGPQSTAFTSNGWTSTLSPFDIAVLQQQYGRNEWATGNTVYELTDDQALASYETIWDTGGNDTIRYRGAANATIDLTAATLDYSPTGGGGLSWIDTPDVGIYGGYILANGVVIENAVGGRGDDFLVANATANVLNGGAGDDIVSYKHSDAAIQGSLQGQITGGHARGDRLVRIEGIEGTRFDDELGGTDANNYLGGLGGNDLLAGGNGDDRLLGGNGSDMLEGGDGNDQLNGGADIDVLDGGNDSDELDGGAGNDHLTGGNGSDTFKFDPFSGTDLIFDLSDTDLINLSAFGTSDEVAINLRRAGRIQIDRDGVGQPDLVILYEGARPTSDQFIFAE